MNDATSVFNRKSNRRKFMKNGMLAAGAATVGAGLLPGKLWPLAATLAMTMIAHLSPKAISRF